MHYTVVGGMAQTINRNIDMPGSLEFADFEKHANTGCELPAEPTDRTSLMALI